jgi:four helix bundle protein
MALARDFSDLDVYKKGYRSAMAIFELSKSWPREERYALTDQIRRSSRSVCTNIAEAWRKRAYPAHFVSKLSDSDCEAGETISWLHFASGCGYLRREPYQQLKSEYHEICSMLTSMMDNADQWCIHRKR